MDPAILAMEANVARWQIAAQNPEAAGKVAEKELLLYGGLGCHAAAVACEVNGGPAELEAGADFHTAGVYLWEQAFSSDGDKAGKDENKDKGTGRDRNEGKDKNEGKDVDGNGGDGCMIM